MNDKSQIKLILGVLNKPKKFRMQSPLARHKKGCRAHPFFMGKVIIEGDLMREHIKLIKLIKHLINFNFNYPCNSKKCNYFKIEIISHNFI